MAIDQNTIWIALAVVGAIIVIALIAAAVRRSRSAQLREHFGSEYDHVVNARGNRTKAEDELIARAEEVKAYDIRPLSASEAQRYRGEWQAIESQFVERPTIAVVAADELIDAIMRAQGYPMGDFERHAANLSVKHPRVIEHYRAGHDAIEHHTPSASSTEDLRQAMLHYRALMDELLGPTDVVRDVPVEREIIDDRAAAARPRTIAEEERLRALENERRNSR